MLAAVGEPVQPPVWGASGWPVLATVPHRTHLQQPGVLEIVSHSCTKSRVQKLCILGASLPTSPSLGAGRSGSGGTMGRPNRLTSGIMLLPAVLSSFSVTLACRGLPVLLLPFVPVLGWSMLAQAVLTGATSWVRMLPALAARASSTSSHHGCREPSPG